MLSASLVLYHTPMRQIKTIINCIIESHTIDRLYVIDNASSQENMDFFSEYEFVEYISHENTGYGSSHNIALKKSVEAEMQYHLILNPDIEFDKEVLNGLKKYMDENDDVVYVLPKVIYPTGELQYLCKLLPTPTDLIFRRFFKKTKKIEDRDNFYSLKHSGYNKIMNPPCLSGCFMFLRVETLQKYNIFFDERFFMYLEDFDLMRRLHRVGKTVYNPNYTIIHNHAKESYKNKKMLKNHIISAIKYFNKYGWFLDKERTYMNNKILVEIETLQK